MNPYKRFLCSIQRDLNVKTRVLISVGIIFLAVCFASTWYMAHDAKIQYTTLLSVTIYDRNGIPVSITENSKGHYASTLTSLPSEFTELLIQKEDKYFRYHPGVNPYSTLRALFFRTIGRDSGGGSTITQQLAKNLLGTELERTFKNKLYEMFYSVSIELFYTKDEILRMYANTVYLGNQIQGFETGSYAYFNKSLRETTYSERVALLATLSYPNTRNPWKEENKKLAEALHQNLQGTHTFVYPEVTKGYTFRNDAFFELSSAGIACTETCTTTIDAKLTSQIRDILNRYIQNEWSRGARNGAVVVIDPHTSELLAFVGSKNPQSTTRGDQINMAIEPRPIGSTVKPFIYLKGFMEGLRPYTIVDDREYKYSIATGFSLYPKNFDGIYHGHVTLHTALSNSFNVPSVKVLEYIGLQNFYAFLSEQLHFSPLKSYESYQYGIALGGLEMDLLTLTHYFTLFPRMGTLEPLDILPNHPESDTVPRQSAISEPVTIADKKYVQLVHAILRDRLTGVEQFGLESPLNIPAEDYGVKTGTSRDFHDSWVIGYTNDVVVGVWVGNTENEALKQVTGQSGAGTVWHEVMELLLASSYNTHTTLPHNEVRLFPIGNSSEWGLPEDIADEHQNLLLSESIIQNPHNNDSFEFFAGTSIPLRASQEVTWTVNGTVLGTGKTIEFHPTKSGRYEITAQDTDSDKREIISIDVATPQ